MGMYSEIIAGITAKRIEEIIKKAVETDNKEIIEFAKKTLVPFYLEEKSEAWEKPNSELMKVFEV